MSTIRTRVLVFGAALLLGACGSSSSNPADGGATGSGGSTGGGSGGTAPGGGSGGASGGGDCGNFPTCVSNLAQQCIPSGACTTQMNGFVGTNICYANGVKVLTTINIATFSLSMRFTKSDGSTCYSQDVVPNATTGEATLTFKNAAGATVATGTSDTTGALTINCGGQSYVVTDQGNCGASSGAGGASGGGSCTMGTCM